MQRKPDYTGADAALRDFAYMALDGISFEGANLRAAFFKGATLSAAKFMDADLSLADMSGARLVMADLRGANLSGTDLTGANLTRANLCGVICDEQTCFEGADLYRATVDPGSLPEQVKMGRTLPEMVPHPPYEAPGTTVEFIGWQERQRRLNTE